MATVKRLSRFCTQGPRRVLLVGLTDTDAEAVIKSLFDEKDRVIGNFEISKEGKTLRIVLDEPQQLKLEVEVTRFQVKEVSRGSI